MMMETDRKRYMELDGKNLVEEDMKGFLQGWKSLGFLEKFFRF